MTTLTDRIYFALNDGMNIRLLLQATGLDRDTFAMKMIDNQFNDDERREIKLIIKEWEDGN